MSKPFLGYQSPPEPSCLDEELEEWLDLNWQRLEEEYGDNQ